eukprot:TRINITY_DN23945_c0_g1_i1.p1 TRINITY_DN23945_c0_g1~~TRINITY_DN23945_c0_g1_i1.p1  ORF type:complete len:445 (+),score=53.90 TRINITY_DN23945_c0_g1_i1:37-1371(+)
MPQLLHNCLFLVLLLMSDRKSPLMPQQLQVTLVLFCWLLWCVSSDSADDLNCQVGYGLSSDVGNPDWDTCQRCEVGKYSPGGDSVFCVSCPEYFRVFSDDPTYAIWGSVCQNLCNASLNQGPVQVLIHDNVTGEVKGNSTFACGCAVGSIVSPENGSCIPCNPGFSSDFNGTSCYACPPGKYSSGNGSSSWNLPVCNTCSSGRYSTGTNQTACLTCPYRGQTAFGNGTHCTCYNGFGIDLSTKQCQFCVAGQYSNQNTSGFCEPCPAGQISFYSGASSCSNCSSGQVPNLSQTNCYVPTSPELCSKQEGAVYNESSTHCVCEPGYYSIFAGYCVLCISGEYSSDYDSTSCSACPSGRWSDSKASSCQACTSSTEFKVGCSPFAWSLKLTLVSLAVVGGMFAYVLLVKTVVSYCQRHRAPVPQPPVQPPQPPPAHLEESEMLINA